MLSLLLLVAMVHPYAHRPSEAPPSLQTFVSQQQHYEGVFDAQYEAFIAFIMQEEETLDLECMSLRDKKYIRYGGADSVHFPVLNLYRIKFPTPTKAAAWQQKVLHCFDASCYSLKRDVESNVNTDHSVWILNKKEWYILHLQDQYTDEHWNAIRQAWIDAFRTPESLVFATNRKKVTWNGKLD